MKRCPKCERTLPLDDFAGNVARRDGKQLYCRPCQRAYVRAHYETNVGYYLAKARRSNAKRVQIFRQAIRMAKDVPCADCGERYGPWMMDFDHVRGTKRFDVGRANSKSMAAILAEIAKCEVVCANCHRQRTYNRLTRAHSSVG